MKSPAISWLRNAVFAAGLFPGLAAACATSGPDDWIARAPAGRVMTAPKPCAVLEHSPPVFVWPDGAPGAGYLVRLRFPDGREVETIAKRNWLAWRGRLEAGEYAWQIGARRGAGGIEWSAARHFRIAEGAAPFDVPDAAGAHAAAAALPRPRAFPSGAERTALHEAFAGPRKPALEALLRKVESVANDPLPEEPQSARWSLDLPARARLQLRAQAVVGAQERRILDALLAWTLTARDDFLAQAKRRALHLARWDPKGATGVAAQDQSGRSIAWTLALLFDWAHARLMPQDQALLLAAILPRTADLFDATVGRRQGIARMPLDSHGAHTLGRLAALAVLLAGETPLAREWADAVPLYAALLSPWGGEDGGYANGTSYAQWDIGEAQLAWDVLRWSIGLDLRSKTWPQRHQRYLAYFLPPGTPLGAFGDGAEIRRPVDWATYGKAYAARAGTPLARWYAGQLFGEDPAHPALLLAPPITAGAPFPEGTPPAALFPDIGWSAMHSDLRDRARVSVYFKSSPYGSHNHGHADQNSFVINAHGRALAIDSGYYDWYGSPHWREWTKQTRAHNAITFDGGQGQALGLLGLGDLGARGKIVAFRHTLAYDWVVGEAARAYGGALTRARRALVYLRPGTIIVFDALQSAAPRRWEWNLHAAGGFTVEGPRNVMIRDGDTSLCAELHGSAPLSFAQTDRFPRAPELPRAPNQHHGVFRYDAGSTSGSFAAILNVDCGGVPARVSRSGPFGWSVETAGHRVVFDGDVPSVL